MKFLKNIYKKVKNEKVLIVLTLLVSAIAHGINMFHFPYLENDEGTYMSQAWSLVTHGQFAPYAYWYDHAPAGWILIAFWSLLSGGFFTFGLSVFSGRVLMLILHVLMSFFLLIISKRFTGKVWAGVIAVIIFSLSPLAIYFDRRVLLDNIMSFWVLLSFVLLLRKQLSLRTVALSAVSFAVAVLSKENAVFFAPGFLYLLFTQAKSVNKKFAITIWLLISGSIISLYFLYAYLQSEFWPVGFLGDTKQHVSLITTLQNQLGRGTGLPFWNKRSDFAISLSEWAIKDPYLIFLAIISTILGAFLSLKNKSIRIVFIFLIFFWLFLLRGKLIIDFYITPLIPWAGLMTGLVLDVIMKRISKIHYFVKNNRTVYASIMGCISLLLAVLFLSITTKQYTKDETTPQIQTIDWVKKNVDPQSYIIIDDYAYVDFHASRFAGDPIFENADWFWKLSSDPAIRDEKYKNDWSTVQYITLSHEMLKQIKVGSQDLLKQALDNAKAVQNYTQNTSSYLDIPHYISTNGDWMSIYKVNSTGTVTIDAAWNYYQKHFIHSYGQVIDPSNDATTSEGQSYAMLRGAFVGDKNTFDGTYAWTKDHLQSRKTDKLFSWLWTKKDNKYQIGDSATASDADEDIALALLIANQKWHDPTYLTDAKQIISDIWEHEVVKINGRYYLTMGDGAKRPEGYLINPSYFSPAAYRLFADIDASHDWTQLADDSYATLNAINAQNKNTAKLPPNWILVRNDGTISSAKKYFPDNADTYGYDAFRVFYRVALDNTWFPNTHAKTYLAQSYPFFLKEWQKQHKIAAVYQLNGDKAVDYDSLSNDTAALMVFAAQDPKTASDFAKEVYTKAYNKNGFWQDGKSYFDQNWAWFATALYTNNLPQVAMPSKK
ncbi:MAG: glycosyl hydrolase family 8 [Candidatus Levyibacteriota bacterium]